MNRFFLAVAAGTIAVSASAQDVPVMSMHSLAVGSITRDAGLYLVPNDVATVRAVNRSLILLESDLADNVSNMQGITYQDRSAVGELLREVHMSSGRDFDPSSGALRGLMGRLDFLIVIDAVDASTAKMRLIDVQTGSVRGVETCTRRTSGGRPPACVSAMAGRLQMVGGAQNSANVQLAEARNAIMAIKPEWDDQVARYDAAAGYWAKIRSDIAPAGHTLRPEIQTLLNGAATDVRSGRFAVEHFDADNLRVALDTLTAKLNRLDAFR